MPGTGAVEGDSRTNNTFHTMLRFDPSIYSSVVRAQPPSLGVLPELLGVSSPVSSHNLCSDVGNQTSRGNPAGP